MQASGNFHCDEHNRTAEQKTELHRTTMTIGGAVYQITRHYRDSGAAAGTYNQAVTNQGNRFDRTRKGAAWNFGQIKP